MNSVNCVSIGLSYTVNSFDRELSVILRMSNVEIFSDRWVLESISEFVIISIFKLLR